MALSKIDVANMLTGATPVANGGTGLSSGTTNQFLKFTGSTTLASAADNAGKILQVVSANNATNQGSTSSTYADTSLTASITPSATSSKVLVFMSINGVYAAAGDTCLDVVLNRTGAGSGNGGILEFGGTCAFDQGNQGSGDGGCTMTHLDSPSSTSSLTYKAQMRSSNGSDNIYINHWVRGDTRPRSTITLMEISA